MQRIRIVTADDHPIFRDGLRRLLESEKGFEVIGEAGSGTEALKMVADLQPDLLLLDVAMPDMSGLEVLRVLSGSATTVRTVLLTAAAEKHQMLEALKYGAKGLILKDSATPLLYKCIRSVMSGEYWFGHDRLTDLIEALRQLGEPTKPLPVDTLTRREIDVIAAVVQGATNKDISDQLGLSEQTVKNHLSHIYDKVGVSNRLELALFAFHHKLLTTVSLRDDRKR